jgi:hypothetical protein
MGMSVDDLNSPVSYEYTYKQNPYLLAQKNEEFKSKKSVEKLPSVDNSSFDDTPPS